MTLAAGFLVEAASDYVVVVLTVTHGYNAVRGHRTGSNNSGAEDYLRRKENKKQKIICTHWCYLVATIRDGVPQAAIVPLPLRTGTTTAVRLSFCLLSSTGTFIVL